MSEKPTLVSTFRDIQDFETSREKKFKNCKSTIESRALNANLKFRLQVLVDRRSTFFSSQNHNDVSSA